METPKHHIEPAAGRTGSEVLEQLQLFAAMQQHCRKFRRIDAMMACLHQSNRPMAERIQVRGEIAQDLVRILVTLVDQRSEIALGVEHGAIVQ